VKKDRSKGLEGGGMCNIDTCFRTRSFRGILGSGGSDRWGAMGGLLATTTRSTYSDSEKWPARRLVVSAVVC
jgi:hypothetical protein